MMDITVMVLEGPYAKQSSDSAWHFIQAALERGHVIQGVFLYNDGVMNANVKMEPPQDDRHIAKRWAALTDQGIEVLVCIAAGKRRGLVEGGQAGKIKISGLGQLARLMNDSDRVITFGAK